MVPLIKKALTKKKTKNKIQKLTTKHSKTKKQNKQAKSIDKPTYLAKITPCLVHQKNNAGIYPLF